MGGTTIEPTRERLLTVAERLLLESGYDNVSVRAINAAAGANAAAVHYHFGSRDRLVAALLEERWLRLHLLALVLFPDGGWHGIPAGSAWPRGSSCSVPPGRT